MCTNGINTGQLVTMIEQIDDHIKLERRWAHTLAHRAEDVGYETAHRKLHEAQVDASLTMDGTTRTLSGGHGYHDHNWDNVSLEYVFNHWY